MSRRRFFKLDLALPADADRKQVKITDIHAMSLGREISLLKILSVSGLEGYGETCA